MIKVHYGLVDSIAERMHAMNGIKELQADGRLFMRILICDSAIPPSLL